MLVKKPLRINEKLNKATSVAEIIHSENYVPSKGVFNSNSTHSTRNELKNRESPSSKTSIFGYGPKMQSSLYKRKLSHQTFYSFNLKMAAK